MDTLVAAYSRPAFEDEGYVSEDQNDISLSSLSLSPKFSLPAVSAVSRSSVHTSQKDANILLAFRLSPRPDRRSLQPRLPHKACTWYDDACFPFQGRYHRRDGLESNRRELDRQSNCQEGN